MAEENAIKPKSSKTCWIIAGSCGCLVILILAGLFAVRTFGGEIFKNIFNPDNTPRQDEENREMTKAELIDYFVIETTTYSSPDTPSKVARWEKPVVTVSVESQPSEQNIKAVDKFITKFNNNSSKTKLQRIENNGDIKIYFETDTAGSAGRSGPSSGADYIIDSGVIKLDERAGVFEQSLDSIFSHEMFHALGFTGHYESSTCRLMSPTTCGSRLTINEERLIQMLYNSGIPLGSDETQIRSYFQNWNPK